MAGWSTAAQRVADVDTALPADLAQIADQAVPLQVTINAPRFVPFSKIQPWDNCSVVDCANLPHSGLNSLNSMDFCNALRNAAMLPASVEHVHTRRELEPAQIAGNVAYALAVVDPLAPAHDATSPVFQSPRRPGGGTDNYQDKVLAVGIDQLWSRLRCGEHYAPALYAHANVAMAARLTTPAMANHEVQLDIMVELGVAEAMNASVALIDATADLINTTSETLDTIAEMFETYGGWNWRVAIAGGSIGTAVGSTIAAGAALAAAGTYAATSRQYRDQFAARFPDEATAPGNGDRQQCAARRHARRIPRRHRAHRGEEPAVHRALSAARPRPPRRRPIPRRAPVRRLACGSARVAQRGRARMPPCHRTRRPGTKKPPSIGDGGSWCKCERDAGGVRE
ncbi:MAG: hypothetical protein ACWGG5_04970 [Stenotrophomonas sp.]